MPNTLLSTIAIAASSVLFVTSVSSETLPSVVQATEVSVFVSPTIPDALELAGERVPIDGFGVRESLDKELIVNTYRHSSTILYLKKSARWFPVIEEILKEEGVPPIVKQWTEMLADDLWLRWMVMPTDTFDI